MENDKVKVIASGNATWGEWKKLELKLLTDEEILEAFEISTDGKELFSLLHFARAIEQALKEKNDGKA